jgi:protein-disulfide isomerase
MNAARAARCSGDQGKFGDMRLALVRNAHLLSEDYIAQAGRQLKLDMKLFTECVTSGQHDDDIRADIAEAKRIGITGTPTFVLGRTTGNGALEGTLMVGALSYSVLDGQLSELLGSGSK